MSALARLARVPLPAGLLFSPFLFAQTPARPAAENRPPAIVRADPNSPANAGRKHLTEYLDKIAEGQTSARHATVAALSTRAQAEARQRAVRDQILKLIGGLPERSPLNAKIVGSTPAEGFRIDKLTFESQPGFLVTALLYVPDTPAGAGQGSRRPAIVVAPGHGPQGKSSDYAFSSTFARNGFIVLDYDPIGQGERLQYPDPEHPGQSLAQRPTGEHGEAGLQPTLIGEAFTRFFAWDAMRAVDYLQSRPDVDRDRIGAFGCSGGGAMTAFLGALDPRIKATGAACFTTSFDTLLPSIGPQDGEQSIPNFIASGLDFPDWVELAAPRAYAIISTTADMFPFAGAQKTEAEARKFYSLFGADKDLDFITGPGGHGNLRPILPQIVSFFLKHLQPGSDFAHPALPSSGGNPFAPPPGLPHDAFQDTPTGQVATSFPGSETVHSLTVKQFQHIAPPNSPSGDSLRSAIREVTRVAPTPEVDNIEPPGSRGVAPAGTPYPHRISAIRLPSAPGITLQAVISTPDSPTTGRHSAMLLIVEDPTPIPSDERPAALPPSASVTEKALANLSPIGDGVTMAVTPRPSPPGTEEVKAAILGNFYLTELRAELVGKTILGMRMGDVIRAIDYLASRPDVDSKQISAQASGHLGLVLLHAAVLDPRLRHITVDHTLSSYRSLVEAAIPINAPEDVLPGVLRRYDIPDLVRELGPRLTLNESLPGDADLSVGAYPYRTPPAPVHASR